MNLCLPYRSQRNYIHSTDIFQSLINVARERFTSDTYVESLVLRRQAAHQLRLSFEIAPRSIGTCAFRVGRERVRGWLIETESDVSTRVPYDESRAFAAVAGGYGFAEFVEPVAGYTAFEHLLVLLQVAGGERGGWLCQTNLRGPLSDLRPLAVRLRLRALRRFFAFEILQNGQTIGEAYASLKEERGREFFE